MDLVSVPQKLLYYWRVFGKVLSFGVFGLGAPVLFLLVFPLMRICIHPAERYMFCARWFISKVMQSFVLFMSVIQVVSLSVDDKLSYANLKSKIVIANHPSILDVVFLIALIPNANCIVRSTLTHTIIGGVIKTLYIPNDENFAELVADCRASLARGECLIIFPEGTRTPDEELLPFKKGFARIALETNCDIVPIRIGGNKKTGLKKGDPMFFYHPNDKLRYVFTMGERIPMDRYKNLAPQIGIRHIAQDSRKALT